MASAHRIVPLPQEHHVFSFHFLWLLLKVYFLRIMSRIDVYMSDHLRPHPKDDVRVEKIRFPSRDKGRMLTAVVYTPVSLPPGPQPVHVNVHGSGFSTSAHSPSRQRLLWQLTVVLLLGCVETQLCRD